MSIFDSITAQPNAMNNAQQQALVEMKHDPHGVIKRCGYNVPDGMNDPQQMVNYLISSGQVGGPRLQMARQLMARLGR